MNLRNFRERDKISQIELAEKVGVAQNTICQWEIGLRRPNIDMLVKLTTIFHCTADELLGIDRSSRNEEELVSGRTELLGIDRNQRDGETNDASAAETQMSGEEISVEDVKRPEPEKPETREEVIARRMSDAIAGAQQKQEG